MAAKNAAVVTLKAPGAMTEEGRKEVGEWLRTVAADLEAHGDAMKDKGSVRFQYNYTDEHPAHVE